MQSRRTQRVASLLRESLAKLLLEDVSDPVLAQVSVMDVELTADLKLARVFYRVFENGPKPADVRKAVSRAMPYLKKKLGEALQLRYVPVLEFILDDHADNVDRVVRLIDSLKENGEVRL